VDPHQGHHLDADLDPHFHFDLDPNPAFHFDADQIEPFTLIRILLPIRSDANQRPLAYRPSKAPF
jgi:hypothetical protein